MRQITPQEYLVYFGNGYAVMRDYMEEHPEVIEGFGMDPANQDKMLEHTTAGNPQEGEDPAFAAALLAAIKGRMTPADPAQG